MTVYHVLEVLFGDYCLYYKHLLDEMLVVIQIIFKFHFFSLLILQYHLFCSHDAIKFVDADEVCRAANIYNWKIALCFFKYLLNLFVDRHVWSTFERHRWLVCIKNLVDLLLNIPCRNA